MVSGSNLSKEGKREDQHGWQVCLPVNVLDSDDRLLDCSPSTFRRWFLDVAGKVISHSRELF